MYKIKKLLKMLKQRKGLTGADIAGAVTVIVLTVGIATSIYVNAVNKSKDNMRYANAVRIATNIMESIQRRHYEYLITKCPESNSYTCNITSSSTDKPFDTKVPSGFSATVKAIKPTVGTLPDVARDVTVNVKYRANNTYKTITLKTVKEREMMDLTNPPDFSLLPKGKFYYPVSGNAGSYKITTTSDMSWYDYEEGKYAVVCGTDSGGVIVGSNAPSGSKTYVWIPRFVVSKTASSGTSSVKFLYGTSEYPIEFVTSGNLSYFGLKCNGTDYTETFSTSAFQYSGFAKDDGLSGVWYEVGGANTENGAKTKATTLKSKINCTNATIN